MGVPARSFEALFDRCPVGLLVRSVETEEFLAVNRAFEDLTGYGREELLGKTPAELGLFAMEHHELTVQKALMTGAINEQKGALRTKDGSMRRIVFSTVRMTVGDEFVVFSAVRSAPE